VSEPRTCSRALLPFLVAEPLCASSLTHRPPSILAQHLTPTCTHERRLPKYTTLSGFGRSERSEVLRYIVRSDKCPAHLPALYWQHLYIRLMKNISQKPSIILLYNSSSSNNTTVAKPVVRTMSSSQMVSHHQRRSILGISRAFLFPSAKQQSNPPQ
jgi:hypothetical protein